MQVLEVGATGTFFYDLLAAFLSSDQTWQRLNVASVSPPSIGQLPRESRNCAGRAHFLAVASAPVLTLEKLLRVRSLSRKRGIS